MPFVLYENLTDEQKQDVFDHLQTKVMTPDKFHECEFWVKPDGHVTRAKGFHRLSDDAYAKHRRSWEGPVSDPRKGGYDHLSSCTFHFAPERAK